MTRNLCGSGNSSLTVILRSRLTVVASDEALQQGRYRVIPRRHRRLTTSCLGVPHDKALNGMKNQVTWVALLALAIGLPFSAWGQEYLSATPEPSPDIGQSTQLPSDVLRSEIWSGSPVVPLGPGIPSSGLQPDPLARHWRKHHPDLTEQLYERVLELEPSADNRRAIERVREVAETTEVGVDTTQEEWVESKKNLTLNWGGRIHTDWATWANDDQFQGQSDYIEFRRLRLMASGEGYGVYFYQLELEFAPEGRLAPQSDLLGEENAFTTGAELKDAYLGMRDVPFFGTVKAGHFFTPLGMESQTSSNSLTFMERGLTSRFLPGREYGLSASNHTADQRWTWAYGAFAYEMREYLRVIENDNQGIRLIGRGTGTPYYDEASGGRYLVHTGLGYAYSRPRVIDDRFNPGVEERPVEFDARPEIHRGDALVTTGVLNTHSFHTVTSELAWVNGPLSVQNEFVWTSLDEVDLGMMNFYATYIDVSYFLTGESRPYNRKQGTFDRVVPLENCWFVRTPQGTSTGWGAWQFAGRWSYLDISDVNNPQLGLQNQQMNDLTLGMNWYLNPHSRIMFNWIHPIVLNSIRSDRETAYGDALTMRLQVDF